MANMKVWRLGMVEKWAAVAGGGFSSTLSCHKYLASSRDARHATAAHILHESPLGDARNVVERFAGAGKKMGLGFRLDEANSLAASGTRGVSDTMAASLYVADVALSIMQVRALFVVTLIAWCCLLLCIRDWSSSRHACYGAGSTSASACAHACMRTP